MAAHPSYRPELDGLRALAVLSVIGFHAEIPGFSGGYLGVDVFFVLSGYLITRIIRRELTDGTFSLRRFYERRARRILPALLLVAIVSIPIGWFYLPPHRMTQFCDSLISLLTFSTNFHFYFESDYFAPAVAESIWVHGWSLALEEQFYVLFPLALLLLRNRPALTQATCMVLVLTLSFALAVFVSSSDGEASFYLLPMRAWELLAGAIVSFERDEYASPWTSGLGLALIAASVAVLPEVPPGWMTVPAVAGTMLLLRYGRGFGVLSYRPWVAIGLVSYSAYLWHQPIFVLARLRSTGPLSPITTSVCIAATGVLAAASWYAFEQPFRRRLRGRTVASTLMAFALGLAAFAVAGRWSGGFPERFPSDEAALLRYLEYDTSESYSDGRCNLTTNQSPAEHAQECLSGDAALLIGDSHAAALSFGLREHLPLRQFTAWGCPPLFDHQAKRMHAPRCAEVQAARREVLQNDVPGTLLLHADWQRYLSETDAAAEALDEFLRFASKRWTVIVIGAVPNWQPSLPEYLIRTRSAGLRNVPTQLESVRRYDEQVQKLAQRHQARFVSLLDGWCTAASCVAVLEDGQLVSWDHSHLTAAGSRWVYETILAPELNAK